MRRILREPASTTITSAFSIHSHCNDAGRGDVGYIGLLEKTLVTELLLCTGGHCCKQTAAFAAHACSYYLQSLELMTLDLFWL